MFFMLFDSQVIKTKSDEASCVSNNQSSHSVRVLREPKNKRRGGRSSKRNVYKEVASKSQAVSARSACAYNLRSSASSYTFPGHNDKDDVTCEYQFVVVCVTVFCIVLFIRKQYLSERVTGWLS